MVKNIEMIRQLEDIAFNIVVKIIKIAGWWIDKTTKK
jgi:hypothetical protein